MADNQIQRPYRSNEPPTRSAPAATPSAASDPLAELARLIGQSDPFAEFGRDNARRGAAPRAAEPAADWAAPPAAPEAPAAAPNFGANDYFGAASAPAAQPPAAESRQPYANPSYAAGADLYHTESAAPGYPAAQASGYDANAYQQQMHEGGEQEDLYDDVPPPRRRMGIMAIAAVFALAVIGTAGAFGYRALFGVSGSSQPPPVIKADTAPSKIVPANPSKAPNKLITDRVADHAQNEKLVSREEQPVEMRDKPAVMAMPPAQDSAPPASAQPAVLGSGVISSEPKKIRTIAIRPEQAAMADSQPVAATAAAAAPPPPPPRMTIAAPVKPAVPPPPPRAASNPPVELNPEPSPAPRQAEARAAPPARQAAAPSNAPLSLSPGATDATAAAPAARAPMRTASVSAPAQTAPARTAQAATGSYAVQVSSQRSEAEAQAAFRGLQAKYPSQLGGRQALIHKVELGDKGTYYRAMVGPFATANEASELCNGLKAAGGQCLIQRN